MAESIDDLLEEDRARDVVTRLFVATDARDWLAAL